MVAENVTRIIKYYFWLTIFTTIFQLAVPQLTPENINYAEIRCQDDFQNAEESLKALWAQRIYPNDKYTHCYINCFLHKLGLINLSTRGLNLEPFVQIIEKTETMTNYVCTEMLYNNEPLDGTCYSCYSQWLNFTEHCNDVVSLVLNDLGKRLIRMQDKLPRWKERGESATQFCDTLLAKSDADVAAEVSDTADNSFESSHKCNLECIFKHFHYFDAYGRLDEAEISRSFKDVNLLTPKNTAIIHRCTHSGNSFYSSGFCEMAYELYSCLQKKTGKDYFKVYQNRDKITQRY